MESGEEWNTNEHLEFKKKMMNYFRSLEWEVNRVKLLAMWGITWKRDSQEMEKGLSLQQDLLLAFPEYPSQVPNTSTEQFTT